MVTVLPNRLRSFLFYCCGCCTLVTKYTDNGLLFQSQSLAIFHSLPNSQSLVQSGLFNCLLLETT
ncbi:uncharacterized protein ASCRUDRAFT_74827 [Ascoidea rubescens DSM 1968]|uniref:Uncharacterized protein n=1 Tax=Ascoidea rubescens DSM 1968 TaxID=1344418 RepID=A0A1D2VLG8_9ASCO|nr:hypothetical protein ASCRUDRAFT_74827 [Ascoidea rubescens DSM 1968]ODV62458.1 hypothetical protein ASCRUDRAFT_74827 [Ascoidea rubescens DSM 1968]